MYFSYVSLVPPTMPIPLVLKVSLWQENLKCHVRDVLNRKRMVAYVLLDNPEDSIMNLQQANFKEGGGWNFEKYMDSFPFPYYVMLNNIEALPRTLADLLRQVRCSTFYFMST
jgi:midasin (ATPase involved in ribosome maturation)